MSQSTFNQSGSTQNYAVSQGLGDVPPPTIQAYPILNLNSVMSNTGTFTLLKSQSGTTFQLAASGATIVLPAPTGAAGWNARFQMQAINISNPWTIYRPDNQLNGILLNVNNGNAAFASTGGTTSVAIKISATGASFNVGALPGDYISVVSDGSRYSVFGVSSTGGFS